MTQEIEKAKALLEANGYFVGKWEPIEKRPLEEKCFIVDCPIIESKMTLAYFGKNGDIVSAFDGKNFIGFKPTHFMKLPEPPKDIK